MSFQATFRVEIGPRGSITAVRDELLNVSRVITFARRTEAAVWRMEGRSGGHSVVEIASITYENPLHVHTEGIADIIPAIIRAVATVGPTYRKAKAEADEVENRRDATAAKEADAARLRQLLIAQVERNLAGEGRPVPIDAITELLDDNLSQALAHLSDEGLEIEVSVEE